MKKKKLKLHPLQMVKKVVCQIEVFSNSSIICKKDCPDIKNYRRNKKKNSRVMLFVSWEYQNVSDLSHSLSKVGVPTYSL